MVIDMKSAFLAERTQVKTPMKGPVIVEIEVHEGRAKGKADRKRMEALAAVAGADSDAAPGRSYLGRIFHR
ncbi:MAG: hypothetical protein ACPH5S_06525, partial [Candidatus Poseidoniaceae archaeon]